MLKIYISQLLVLCRRLLICYLVYFFCRVLFFYANQSFFPATGILDLLKDCFFGLRFDSFSIVVANSLFILLSILPVKQFYSNFYQLILKCVFLFTNILFLMVNLVDVAYFRFIRKRSTYDLFAQVGGQTDISKLLPQFTKDFWWLPLFFTFIILLILFFYRRIKIKKTNSFAAASKKEWTAVIFLFLLCTGLSVLAVRGGFQRMPVDIVNAGAVTTPEEVPIVLNTPFTIIKSVNMQSLTEHRYYSENELKTRFNPIQKFESDNFKKQNVVVIILESFSKEYTAIGNRKSITPFLDSLMGKSLVFTNAFSNGTRSIEGIPAILSGMPSFMENPIINSIYANNVQTSLASVLKKEGYKTAFFHGGINGTMNFDDWSVSAGYDSYFGKKEYNNDDDFDDFWGIWDEPFLQYTVKQISGMPEPFHAAIFTLSSHHPYFIPEKYESRFPKGKLENTASVEYADFALKKFFESAKNTKWYNNTLFVLAADHASISEDAFYSNVVGNQSIPIAFYRADDSLSGKNKKTFSQMDILPSVLNYLGYNKLFFSFGQSYLEKARRPSYFYSGGIYFCYTDSMLYSVDERKIHQVFNYRRDSLLTNDLINRYPGLDATVFGQFKAFVQTYNNTLIKNSATAE